MDFNDVLRSAWAITWRHRFLWVLGFFAGTPASSCGNVGNGFRGWSTGDRDRNGDGGMRGLLDDAGTWVQNHATLVITVIAVVVVIGLVMSLISLIAQGGLCRATADVARGRPSSLGAAWRTGLGLFWRYFRLNLIQAAVSLPLVLLGAAAGILVVTGTGGIAVVAILGIAGIILFVAFIPVTIAFAYAQRSLVLSGGGARASFGVGVRLLTANLGSSVVAWAVLLGVTLAAGVALIAAAIAAALVLLIVGLIGYAVAGQVAIVLLLVMGGAAFLAGSLLFSAVVSTFNASYWTLVYLRLNGEDAAVAA